MSSSGCICSVTTVVFWSLCNDRAIESHHVIVSYVE